MNTELTKQTMANTQNAELMAYLATGTNEPQAVQAYEKQLIDVSMLIIRGDLSPVEKVLSDQIQALNAFFVKFMNKANSLSGEDCDKQFEVYCKQALACQDKAMKAIAQLAKMKAPKKGSVYIRTVNQQNNSNVIPAEF